MVGSLLALPYRWCDRILAVVKMCAEKLIKVPEVRLHKLTNAEIRNHSVGIGVFPKTGNLYAEENIKLDEAMICMGIIPALMEPRLYLRNGQRMMIISMDDIHSIINSLPTLETADLFRQKKTLYLGNHTSLFVNAAQSTFRKDGMDLTLSIKDIKKLDRSLKFISSSWKKVKSARLPYLHEYKKLCTRLRYFHTDAETPIHEVISEFLDSFRLSPKQEEILCKGEHELIEDFLYNPSYL